MGCGSPCTTARSCWPRTPADRSPARDASASSGAFGVLRRGRESAKLLARNGSAEKASKKALPEGGRRLAPPAGQDSNLRPGAWKALELTTGWADLTWPLPGTDSERSATSTRIRPTRIRTRFGYVHASRAHLDVSGTAAALGRPPTAPPAGRPSPTRHADRHTSTATGRPVGRRPPAWTVRSHRTPWAGCNRGRRRRRWSCGAH